MYSGRKVHVSPWVEGGIEFGGELIGVGIFCFIAFQFFVLAFIDFPIQR
jgi:hypothetical protein